MFECIARFNNTEIKLYKYYILLSLIFFRLFSLFKFSKINFRNSKFFDKFRSIRVKKKSYK